MNDEETNVINFQVQYFPKKSKEKLFTFCSDKQIRTKDFLYHICENCEEIYELLKKKGCIR